jgi:predicted acetyltransferase
MESPAAALPGDAAQTCQLTEPSDHFRDSFLEGAAEFASEGRLESTYAAYLGYDLKRLGRDFASFVWDLRRMGDPSRLHQSGYQDLVYWLVEGGRYLGQSSIRPELGTPYLITYGGHIGYSIRPMLRRLGYGRKILQLALERCGELGLKRVLVTCDEDNEASRRIIEANGGLFESSLVMDAVVARAEGRRDEDEVRKLRYWFELDAPSPRAP